MSFVALVNVAASIIRMAVIITERATYLLVSALMDCTPSFPGVRFVSTCVWSSTVACFVQASDLRTLKPRTWGSWGFESHRRHGDNTLKISASKGEGSKIFTSPFTPDPWPSP